MAADGVLSVAAVARAEVFFLSPPPPRAAPLPPLTRTYDSAGVDDAGELTGHPGPELALAAGLVQIERTNGWSDSVEESALACELVARVGAQTAYEVRSHGAAF